MIKTVDGNSGDFRLVIIALFFLTAMSLIPVYQTVVDIGDGITHQNHEDTITTPLPGNKGCDYPPCADGTPQITLEPTSVISTIEPFPPQATPDIPDPTQFPTAFPTFEIDGLLPTPLQTNVIPTIAPTLQPPTIVTPIIDLDISFTPVPFPED